jgi:hypothetical protein
MSLRIQDEGGTYSLTQVVTCLWAVVYPGERTDVPQDPERGRDVIPPPPVVTCLWAVAYPGERTDVPLDPGRGRDVFPPPPPCSLAQRPGPYRVPRRIQW